MNQRDEFSQELFSAYVDGELSPDELARVEQWLASSEAYRQTLDELESLAGELRALPVYRLSDHFPQRVLEAARRIDPAIESHADMTTRPVPELPAGSRRWSVGVALAVAVAASLLAAVFYAVVRDRGDDGTLPAARSFAKTDLKANAPPMQAQDGSRDKEPIADVAVPSTADLPARDVAEATRVPPAMAPASSDAAASSTVAQSTTPAQADGPDGLPGPPTAMVTGSRQPSVPPVSSVAADSETPLPAQTAAEQTPGGFNGMPGPLLGTQKMLFVIDVELTRAGAEEGSFERAMNAFGIAFDTNIDVKPDLENALLKSRFFEPAKDPENPAGKMPLMLVYVATQGGAVDNLSQYMKQNEAQFARVRFDLAIKPGDMTIFQQLQQLANFPTGPAAGPGEPQQGTVAHRLILPPSWRGMPTAAGQGAGGLARRVPDLLAPQGSGADSVLGTPKGSPSSLRDPASTGLFGGNIYTEALFVVHAADSK